MAFRDKNTSAGWTSSGRTPLDQRHYSLLNWRSDVVVIVTDEGAIVQHVRYTDSGTPWGIPAGDVNGDGIVDVSDTGIILNAIGGTYNARFDLNLDGVVDADDLAIANNNLGDTLGHNALSLNPSSDARGGHRLGYTGHTHADVNNALVVMRNRWYSADLGRFLSRDPMGFVDGKNVYGYARGNGLSGRDPMGLFKMPNVPKFGIGSTTCVAGIPGEPNGCVGGNGGPGRPASYWPGFGVHANCEPAFSECLQNDPRAQHAAQRVAESCPQSGGAGPAGIIRCPEGLSFCEPDPVTGQQGEGYARPNCLPPSGPGSYDTRWRVEIVICPNTTDFCEVLAHELIHMAQYCEMGIDYNCYAVQRRMRQNRTSICMEYEAYSLANNCGDVVNCCRRACVSATFFQCQANPAACDILRAQCQSCCIQMQQNNCCASGQLAPGCPVSCEF